MDFQNHWYRLYYDRFETDRQLAPFRKIPLLGPNLAEAREALQLRPAAMAERLDIGRQTYARFENSNDLPLKTLRRCAAAMDCEVVLAIRPQDGLLFSDLVWREMMREIRSFTLANVMHQYMDPRCRVRHGWRKWARLRS